MKERAQETCVDIDTIAQHTVTSTGTRCWIEGTYVAGKTKTAEREVSRRCPTGTGEIAGLDKVLLVQES